MSLARAGFGSGSSLLRSCLSSLRPTGVVAAPSLARTYAVESKKSLEQRALLGDKALYKTYKPITNGIRHLKRPIYNHLWPGRPLKLLTVAQRKNGGRNNTGRIVVRHRGGGHRRRIRLLDFHRTQPGEHDVVRIEYDPGRSAHIALLMSRDPKVAGPERFSYIIAPDGVRAGDVVESFRQGIPAGLVPGYVDRQTPLVYASTSSGPRSVDAKIDTVKLLEESRATLIQGLLRQRTVRTGNCLPIRLIPPGTVIHAISLKRDGPARLVRAAGTYGMLMSHESKGKYAQVRLQSGEVRLVSNECVATVGKVSNAVRTGRVLGKAGRKRWLGFRPAVRGVAMNKVDHPHGGGRGKSKSNKIPRSPWGWITKGKRTRKPLPKGPRGGNKWVVKERPRGKDKRTQKEDE